MGLHLPVAQLLHQLSVVNVMTQQRRTLPTGQQQVVPGSPAPAPTPPPIFDQSQQPGLGSVRPARPPAGTAPPASPQVSSLPPSLRAMMPGGVEAIEAFSQQVPPEVSPALLGLLHALRSSR